MQHLKEKQQELIELCLEIYREKPWDLFDDTEVFELKHGSTNIKEYGLFCEVNHRKCIRLFSGTKAFHHISNYFRPAFQPRVDIYTTFERSGFDILFDFEEQVDEAYREIGQEMGLSARELPVAFAFESYCYLDTPSELELTRCVEILKGLLEGMKSYLSSGMDIDFMKNHCVYDLKKKTCSLKRTSFRPRQYDEVEIGDPMILEELQSLDRTDEIWEVDVQVSHGVIPREHDQRDQAMYVAVIALPLTGQVVCAVPFQHEFDFQFQCIDLIIEALVQRQIPRMMVVRHPMVKSSLKDLCQQLNIVMTQMDELEIIDDFFDQMPSFLENIEPS